jgi:hypothetical protein
MFWWRGKGLVMGLIVAVLVLGAGRQLGKFGVPIGLTTAAVVVFGLREWAGEESSLYSVPVRIWPVVLLVFAAITFFSH